MTLGTVSGLFLSMWVGCGSPEGAPSATAPATLRPAPSAPDVSAVPSEPAGVTLVPGGTGAAVVRVNFEGVAKLHRGFFSKSTFVEGLSRDLAPCGPGPTEVLVSYDSDKRVGRIEVLPDVRTFGCLPHAVEGDFQLSPMTPVGRALAAYRDRVAAAFDIRIASFETGVRLLRGLNLCRIDLAGQYPPDGSTWSPCVQFAGTPHCAEGGEEGVTELHFSTSTERDYFSACVGS